MHFGSGNARTPGRNNSGRKNRNNRGTTTGRLGGSTSVSANTSAAPSINEREHRVGRGLVSGGPGGSSARRFSRDRESSPSSGSPRRAQSSGGGFGGRGDRVMSNSWGRLKPVIMDSLEELGLPSKGDTRLLDFKTQERYYTKIVERYMAFCSDAGQRDELLRRFAALDLTKEPISASFTWSAPLPCSPLVPSLVDHASTDGSLIATPASNKDLSLIISALRKLREGLVASKRADNFAVQGYLFCIRLCILVQHPEGYHPAILHLLRRIHPLASLTSLELAEVVGYLVLDAACRRGQLAEAHAVRKAYGLRDGKIDALLKALATDNYVVFRRVKGSVDGHKARIMEFAEKDTRNHLLKCFGRAYFSTSKEFLEGMTGMEWEGLQKEHGVGWILEGNTVVIRKVKQR